MENWHSQGPHRYRIDGDFVRWRLRGPVTREDLKVMFDVWAQLGLAYGTVYTLIDVRDGVSVSSEARHYIGERTRTSPANGATAIVGASLIIRTVVQLLHNALRILGRTLPAPYFCTTLEDAETWLATERERRGGDAAHAG